MRSAVRSAPGAITRLGARCPITAPAAWPSHSPSPATPWPTPASTAASSPIAAATPGRSAHGGNAERFDLVLAASRAAEHRDLPSCDTKIVALLDAVADPTVGDAVRASLRWFVLSTSYQLPATSSATAPARTSRWAARATPTRTSPWRPCSARSAPRSACGGASPNSRRARAPKRGSSPAAERRPPHAAPASTAPGSAPGSPPCHCRVRAAPQHILEGGHDERQRTAGARDPRRRRHRRPSAAHPRTPGPPGVPGRRHGAA